MILAARERLVLDAACALHANGQETEDTAEAVDRLGRALGLSASPVLRWDGVLLQAETADGHAGLRSRSVTPTMVGMNRVSGVMHCIEAAVCRRSFNVGCRQSNRGSRSDATLLAGVVPSSPVPRGRARWR